MAAFSVIVLGQFGALARERFQLQYQMLNELDRERREEKENARLEKGIAEGEAKGGAEGEARGEARGEAKVLQIIRHYRNKATPDEISQAVGEPIESVMRILQAYESAGNDD